MSQDIRVQHTHTHCTVEQEQTDAHFLLCSRDGSSVSAGYLPSIRSICTSPTLPLDQPHSQVTEWSTVFTKALPKHLRIVCEILTRTRLRFDSAFTTVLVRHFGKFAYPLSW